MRNQETPSCGKGYNVIKASHRYAVQGSDTTMLIAAAFARTIKFIAYKFKLTPAVVQRLGIMLPSKSLYWMSPILFTATKKLSFFITV